MVFNRLLNSYNLKRRKHHTGYFKQHLEFISDVFLLDKLQRDEIERLQNELDRRNFNFVRASHTSDGSFTDTEMPGVSASFAEKVWNLITVLTFP